MFHLRQYVEPLQISAHLAPCGNFSANSYEELMRAVKNSRQFSFHVKPRLYYWFHVGNLPDEVKDASSFSMYLHRRKCLGKGAEDFALYVWDGGVRDDPSQIHSPDKSPRVALNNVTRGKIRKLTPLSFPDTSPRSPSSPVAQNNVTGGRSLLSITPRSSPPSSPRSSSSPVPFVSAILGSMTSAPAKSKHGAVL